MRIVIDTGVAVSAVLLPRSVPRQAFDVAAARGRLLVSDETIAELDEVLRRPKFDKYVSQMRRMEFLSALVRVAEVIHVVDVVTDCRDPSDNKFLALALSGKGSHIITGDSDLLELHPFREIAIVSAQSFLAMPGVQETSRRPRTSHVETMTSRERVLTALSHAEPDRVPIDLGGNQTGIHKSAYRALIEHLGLDEQIEIMDAVQQLARPSEAVLERLRVDTRYIHAGAASDYQGEIVTAERDGTLWHDLVDEFGIRWSMPGAAGLYMDITHHPLADATLDDLKDYPFPRGNDPARFVGLRERAMRLRSETPYAVVSGISGVVYEICWYLRGLEQWFIDMLEQPQFCEALLDQTLQFWLDWFDGFLSEVADVVDVIMIGDDIAGQRGPLFRPEFYRTVVKPRQKKLVQAIKSRTSAKIWYHTCGSCRSYIPDLIDNGIDALNPVQISASDMDPVELKAEFGSRLTFWGGAIDAQHVLPNADPDTVRQHVRRNLKALMPGGGYVFNNVHNIQAGVPAENVLALYDAAYDYGFYR